MFRGQIDNAQFAASIQLVMRRQLPRAQANAVNATLADVKKNTVKNIKKRFNKPVPYMTNTAVFIYRASSARTFGLVGIKDHQASMFWFQEEGGARAAGPRKFSGQRGTPGGKMIPVPTGIDLNAAENMTPRAIKRALARKDTFQAGRKQGLHPGVYRRLGPERRIVSLIAYKKSVQYKPRFDFRKSTMATINAQLPVHYARAIMHELSNPVFKTRRGQKRF